MKPVQTHSPQTLLEILWKWGGSVKAVGTHSSQRKQNFPEKFCGKFVGITWEGSCRDEDWGFQLYQSDPSGNYGGWKATAIGANKQAAQNLLKQDYEEDITSEKAIRLVIKVLPSLRPTPTPLRQKAGDLLAGMK